MKRSNKLETEAVALSIVGVLAGCSTGNNAFGGTTPTNRTNQSVINISTNTPGTTVSNQTGITNKQLQGLYQAMQGVPTTPKRYADAYMNSIATRTGLYARAYLAPSIRNQIPARTIGSSKWIGKWTINPVKAANLPKGASMFKVIAHACIPGKTASKGAWKKCLLTKLLFSRRISLNHLIITHHSSLLLRK